MISTKRSTGLRLGQDLRVLLQAIVALHVPAHHAVSLRYADPHHIRHEVLPHHAPEPMRGPLAIRYIWYAIDVYHLFHT